MGFGVEQGPELLFDLIHLLQSLKHRGVPLLVIGVDVRRFYSFATTFELAINEHFGLHIEQTVFVRDFLVRMDIADRDLKSVTRAHGIAVAAVVHVFGKIPAYDTVPFFVDKGVFINGLAKSEWQALVLFGGEVDFQVIFYIHNGALRNELSGKYAVPDYIVDVTDAGVGMDHVIGWFSSSLPASRIWRNFHAKKKEDFEEILNI